MSVEEDGWSTHSQNTSQDQMDIKCGKYIEGLGILEHQYSLEPDMITGWTPKLPAFPIPLHYKNHYNDQIRLKIEANDLYTIVYHGPRYFNSVQMHKSFTYKWKYRQRYDIKLNSLIQAVENVGRSVQKSEATYANGLPQKSLQDYIEFDSKMESGNLAMAVCVKRNEYDCFIRSDTNTLGHTNWYYFKVNNKKHIGIVQFNICNITKTKNLYSTGMTPFVCHQTVENNQKWEQGLCFDTNFVERICRYGTNNLTHQLQFKYDFKQPNQEVYFAYSIPYTYSRLQNYLEQIKNHPCVKVSTLCESLSGLDIPLVCIDKKSIVSHKYNFLITARIHPGETNSSFIIQGLLRKLVDGTQKSETLLNFYTFYIIPMINPDGVIAGNFRTSLSGQDLNRRFDEIGNPIYPEINGLTDLVSKLKEGKHKMEFYCDFHSHSSKKDYFCYGPEHKENSVYYFRSKYFSKLIEKSSKLFRHDKSLFKISEAKKTTGRAYMLEKEMIPMSFTFEVSNGLYSAKADHAKYINADVLLEVGKDFIASLHQYYKTYNYNSFENYLKRTRKHLKQQTRYSLNNNHLESMHSKKSLYFFSNKPPFNSASEAEKSNNFYEKVIKEIQIEEYDEKESVYSDTQDNIENLDEENRKNLFQIIGLNLNLNIKKTRKQRVPWRKKQNAEFKRMSLNRITTAKDLTKNIVRLKSIKNFDSSKGQKGFLEGKYKKNRIYYEQTHPRSSKKEGVGLEEKKAIRQKRFPILI